LEVGKAVNQVSVAKIILDDGDDTSERFSASDSSHLAPGAEIEIQLGYGSDLNRVFKGIVIKHGIRLGADFPAQLVVECFDLAVKMTITSKTRYFNLASDSAVLTTLIAHYGLAPKVTSTPTHGDPVGQYQCTDWDLLVARARSNGMVVLSDAGQVTVAPPDLTRTPVWQLTVGQDILAFQADLDVRTQWAAVQCSAWDSKKLEPISATASPGNLNPLGADNSSQLAKVTGADGLQLESAAELSASALKDWAQAIMLQSELAKVSGLVKFPGAQLNPGDMLQLTGLGQRFSGNAYVGAIRHEVKDGRWTTEATLGIKPEWTACPGRPSAAGLLPPVTGLQIGVVSQIDQDPAGDFRVRVTAPLLNEISGGIWARLAGSYATEATDGSGLFFYPEIGDEVILGFLNGNSTCPVILGRVLGATRKPSGSPDQQNATKSITTHSPI
jgi:Rhs element Vgr protein